MRQAFFIISIVFFVAMTTVAMRYDYGDAGTLAVEETDIPVAIEMRGEAQRKIC
ncbi:hypothetical protein HFP57_09820 [Parasphingopyxis algicola]|uniref:hypothetical protein n=1 Tax=Parasphingopyxis algicola TaxID=2026624 RepID=UPI0015A262D5|nr:hypothetical protein [Parasphingopyxis algicola]QLC25287.1 hypothetical protein HFP57_09820 [Parasphingopyxis algicola]